MIVKPGVVAVEALDPSLPTGFKVFSLADPTRPRELAFYRMLGRGVHRMKFVDVPYAYMSGSDVGFHQDRQTFMVFDLSDPTKPVETGRWWLPGTNVGAGERPTWLEVRWVWNHHANIVGDRAYCSWWDAGVVILDISDRSRPEIVTHLTFDDMSAPPRVAGSTHSVWPIPERGLLIVTEEELTDNVQSYKKYVRVIDISNERRPRQISILPEPVGDYSHRGGRFGPLNLHERRLSSYQNADEVFVTYFNAGVRVYDIRDPFHPREVALHVPPPTRPGQPIQMNDIIVDDQGVVYATDRFGGGLYIFERTGAC